MPTNYDLKSLLRTVEPPELGPGPRAGVESEASLNKELAPWLKSSGISEKNQDLIRALLLLWHDHLDAAHRIAQDIDDSDGAFVHGIMHRREPDYGNAKYWFRHVGKHPSFRPLSQQAGAFLEQSGQKLLLARLAPGGEWDAFAFVDACEESASRPATDPLATVLRQVQRLETEVLLERFAATE